MEKRHLLIFISTILISCANIGQAELAFSEDFSNYISIGGAYTAGVSDGTLTRQSQIGSYPNIIARQLSKSGGGTFNLPLIDNGIVVSSTEPNSLNSYVGRVNNFGIPNIKIYNTSTSGLGNPSQQNFNPFFSRLLSVDQQNKSYLEIVKQNKPTIVTVEFGTDDLLDFINSGGSRALTDYTVFHTSFSNVLTSLSSVGAKTIVANVPDLSIIPALRTYTLGTIQAQNANKDIFIRLSNDKIRKATASDLFLKSAFENIGKIDAKGNSIGFLAESPVPHEQVLDESETATLVQVISFYNASIERLCKEKAVQTVDLFSLFNTIYTKSIDINGVKIDGTIGNFYSKDGISLTNRGNSIIANEFIKAINSKFQSQVPLVDIK